MKKYLLAAAAMGCFAMTIGDIKPASAQMMIPVYMRAWCQTHQAECEQYFEEQRKNKRLIETQRAVTEELNKHQCKSSSAMSGFVDKYSSEPCDNNNPAQ